jgi:hypothetical protein
MKYVVLLFAFASAVTMARTAHLGGQIRHTEIQSTVMATSNEQENGENAKQEKGSTQNEGKDDDD